MSRRRRIRFNPAQALRWRAPDKETIALTLLTAGEAFHSFSSFLPSYFTIKSLALQPGVDGLSVQQKVTNLRSGYVPAVALATLLGGVVSVIAEHPLPLMVASGSSVVMVLAYESALPAGVRVGTAPAPIGPMPGAGIASPPLPNVGGF